MKKFSNIMILLLLLSGSNSVYAQIANDIANANKAGKAVFLIAYNAGGADADKAVSIANNAKKAFKVTPAVVKLNTSDAANSALVTKYRLAGAPSPLILVLDKNGNTAGGVPLKDATAEKLVDMIPTPKSSDLIKALGEGKSVYIVAYKESMSSKKTAMDNCAAACGKMDNQTVTIRVDMDDKNEAKLLKSLKCDLNAKEPVTYVINKSGQVSGTYNGLTDVNTLVSTAKKAPAKSCCPGGAKAGGCK